MSKTTKIQVDELVIAAEVAGDQRRPALLLLHGWPHNRRVYDQVIDRFAEGYFTIAPDLPGIGESVGAPPSAEKGVIADLVLRATETLGARDLVIGGFDVGGMIAFAAAREHGGRIRGAIVANTVVPGIDPWTEVMGNPHIWHFAFHSIPGLPETLVTGHQRDYFDFFANFLAGKKEAITSAYRDAFAAAYDRSDALKAGFDWYRAMELDAKTNRRHKRVDTPMLYLRGDADGGNIDGYLAGLKAAGAKMLRGEVIKGSGEFLPLETPDAFVEIVSRFAKDSAGASAKAA
jgi:pimeloyl-ACP methyl ester carboxylesterase